MGLHTRAQVFVDVGAGISNQDDAQVNVAFRKQFTEGIRLGFAMQSSSIRYRFIGAKNITSGSSFAIGIPAAIRLYGFEKLRLDFYGNTGLRFQGIAKNQAEVKKLAQNTSVAFFFEPGLQVGMALTDKLNVQSGVTLPNIFEVTPQFLHENITTNLFANVGFAVTDYTALCLR